MARAQNGMGDGNYQSYTTDSTDYMISDDATGLGTKSSDQTEAAGYAPEISPRGDYPQVQVIKRDCANHISTIMTMEAIRVQGYLGFGILSYDGGGTVVITIPSGATFTGRNINGNGIPDAFDAEPPKGTIKKAN